MPNSTIGNDRRHAPRATIWPTITAPGGSGRRRVLAGVWVSMSPALMATGLIVWLLAWHHSLILVLGFSPGDFRTHLLLLAGLYTLVALAFALLVHVALLRWAGSRRATRTVMLAAAFVFLLSGVMRVLDWGTFYYSAGHVDEDFWASVFYRQNLGFASAAAAWWPIIAFAAATFAFARLLALACRFAVASTAGSLGAARRSPVRVLWLNAAAVSVIVATAHVAWVIASPPRGREVSRSVRLAFAGLPEYKVLEPFIVRAMQGPPRQPSLGASFVAKLERAGIRLRSVDAAYPLLKSSIYLDAASRHASKPSVRPGTNVIVILAESLSSDLLKESVHGVRGLTPNFADFAAHAYTFRNLYCADFPTIKGQIASLASFAFDHRGLPSTSADNRSPLQSRYLFLSDVLKERAGYATLHVQSDFGRFANTTAIFQAHHYDVIRSADDAQLLREASQPLTKTWGIADRDLFAAIETMLSGRQIRQPFLMTVATTDMHFPFRNLLRHPGTGGNELLDAVYTEDQAFGVFWNYFKRSSWAANTVLLITADHSLVRRAIRKGGADPKPSEFDYVAGMLYVPGAEDWAGRGTDVTCSQIDLAPTLLDLLNIDTPNPFLGLSIFSERAAHPLVLGREIPTGRLSPEARRAVESIDWSEGDQARFQALLRYLAVSDRVMPQPAPSGR